MASGPYIALSNEPYLLSLPVESIDQEMRVIMGCQVAFSVVFAISRQINLFLSVFRFPREILWKLHTLDVFRRMMRNVPF